MHHIRLLRCPNHPSPVPRARVSTFLCMLYTGNWERRLHLPHLLVKLSCWTFTITTRSTPHQIGFMSRWWWFGTEQDFKLSTTEWYSIKSQFIVSCIFTGSNSAHVSHMIACPGSRVKAHHLMEIHANFKWTHLQAPKFYDMQPAILIHCTMGCCSKSFHPILELREIADNQKI